MTLITTNFVTPAKRRLLCVQCEERWAIRREGVGWMALAVAVVIVLPSGVHILRHRVPTLA